MTNNYKTVGVYLYFNGTYAFAFGPNKNKGKLGIARLGGHIEAGESIIDCALREVREEASVVVELMNSPVTFHMESWDSHLIEVEEEICNIKPIVKRGHNVMFFARAFEAPVMSSEIQGIIFVDELEIMKICNNQISYSDFLAWGGRSITRKEYPKDYVLQPLGQMKFLARLIQERPEILKNIFG